MQSLITKQTLLSRLPVSRLLFITVLCLAAVVSATACGAGKPGATTIASASPKSASPGASTVLQAPLCTAADCPNLVITQSGKVSQYNLSARGIQSAVPFARPEEQTQNSRWTIDTGLPSPNGQWIACTTIGSETGGPVLLQNLATSEWTNLIQALNDRLPGDQPASSLETGWDVIGWLPDSASLMISPTDISQVIIVSLSDFAARQFIIPSGGRGGRMFVGLAPDGSRFSYIGEDASGDQVLNVVDLQSGQTTSILKQPYAEGILYNPRFSPGQDQIAYVLQQGRPDTGLAYSINLLAAGEAQPRVLVSGNLGLTVPVWSPDGQSIAFSRYDGSEPARFLPDTTPQPQNSSIWVVSAEDGKTTQVTALKGQARSPAWAKDSQMLAYVTGDGQVQMVNITQPGKTWQAAGPSPDPALTSAFFLP